MMDRRPLGLATPEAPRSDRLDAPVEAGQAIAERVRFHDLHPTIADLRTEVLEGLGSPTKHLPPKLFYDEAGSRLFDAITELPEYYPTRTEIEILRTHGPAMAERLGRDTVLVELGSGSSLKIQTLLAVLQPRIYMPVDISRGHLLKSAEALAARFPTLQIHAVCADYSVPFQLPVEPGTQPLAAFFPGSSIGNFEPDQAHLLLSRVAMMLGPGGRLLVGVDLRKEASILDAAYNDAQGVTAAFNRNLLTRINRELAGDFVPDRFAHRAFFNAVESRVEMHLVSLVEQRVQVADRTFTFRCDESIHTESSYKYSIASFQRLAEQAGFAPEAVWTDPRGLFSVHCLRVL